MLILHVNFVYDDLILWFKLYTGDVTYFLILN